MSIDKLNGWLTLAANVGVLVGIFFLASELQQNTNVARSSAYENNVQEINSWRALLTADEELALIFNRYIRDDTRDLEAGERTRLSQLMAILMTIYENGYFSHQRGIMGQSEWSFLEVRACEHANRLARNDLFLSVGLTEEFNNYLTQSCN